MTFQALEKLNKVLELQMQMGINVVDSSVGGLGGCPYAKGATGNVATEEVLYLLNGLGIQTGVDFDQVMAAGDFICGHLGRSSGSKLGRAFINSSQEMPNL